MTLRNRKDARNSLVTAATAGIGSSFAAIYDHLPKTFEGQSPVLTVQSGFTFPPEAYPAHENRFAFVMRVWVDRGDAAGAEDTLDDLDLVIRSFIAGEDLFKFFLESEIEPEVLQKNQYLTERHFVSIDWDG